MHTQRLRFLRHLLLAPSLLACSLACLASGKTLEPLWQTEGLAVPESVLYVDAAKPYLFVSLIDGIPNEADGKGGIAKMSPEGEIIDATWLEGLNAPKGMALSGNLLYVADITEFVVIDITKAAVVKKIAVADAVFLNDVAVNAKGEVFVSDTRTNRVYRYNNGEVLELYLDDVTSANGLYTWGEQLVVGAGHELLAYGPDKQPQLLAKGFAETIDGIEMTEPGEFIVTCWKGLIYYVHADGRVEQLLDSREQEINTADIGYDHSKRRLFVPNFFKNTVTSYTVK